MCCMKQHRISCVVQLTAQRRPSCLKEASCFGQSFRNTGWQFLQVDLWLPKAPRMWSTKTGRKVWRSTWWGFMNNPSSGTCSSTHVTQNFIKRYPCLQAEIEGGDIGFGEHLATSAAGWNQCHLLYLKEPLPKNNWWILRKLNILVRIAFMY